MELEILKILARNVRMYRHLKNLLESDLAEKIGMTKDYVSKLERGKQKNPGLLPLIKISQVLNIEVFQLFMEDAEALHIKFIVGKQNLDSLERVLDKITERVDIRFKVDTKRPIFYHASDCKCEKCREKRGEK